MKEILRAIVNMYREKWFEYYEVLKEYPENEIAEYKKQLYFEKYCIADQAEMYYNAGGQIDLTYLARCLDNVNINIQPPKQKTIQEEE